MGPEMVLVSDPNSQERPARFTDHSPFMELLGLGPVEVANGRGRLELVVQERHLRSRQLLHGGVMAALLDSVMGMTAANLSPPNHFVLTVQLSVNFIRPAWPGEKLVATSAIRHIGRKTMVGQGEVHTNNGVLAALGSATFMVVAEDPKPLG